jgi:hypothetical protein
LSRKEFEEFLELHGLICQAEVFGSRDVAREMYLRARLSEKQAEKASSRLGCRCLCEEGYT